jgi:hypothetical protein
MGVKLNHGRNRIGAWLACALIMVVAFICAPAAQAQTLTTGAISGVVADPTGAVVPHASVTATNVDTNAARTEVTGASGDYTFSQLAPGQYKLEVKAEGFRGQVQGPVAVPVSQSVNMNFTLEVGQSTQTVEVNAVAPLIQTDNPNTTTAVSAETLAQLPNPGNDLTYVAQIAPGAVMNTSGGFGNVEYNGLPAESNNFTIDGLDANDPFLNLNNSGATNLQLGLNAVAESDVNTLSYSVDQGRQGASQINYLSKSGTNGFHGNAFEIWNGREMNAADFFNNALPGPATPKPFSNVNQFGVSVGGPIRKDKDFFFFDYEGIRIALPVTTGETLPSSQYESYVLSQIPLGGVDPLTGATYQAPANASAATSYYQKAFALYGTPSGTPAQILGCPFSSAGAFTAPTLNETVAPNDGCGYNRNVSLGSKTNDNFINGRVDENIGQNNHLYEKFVWERGIQATVTDPVNSLFDDFSTQPQVTADMGFTHTFSPTLVNEFTPGFYWYRAIFGATSITAASAASPIEFIGPFSPIYNLENAFPQGRDVTNYTIIDNLTWTHGTHTLKFGENFRRTLASNHDLGGETLPVVSPGDIFQYSLDIANGPAGFTQQNFPVSDDSPLGVYNLDLYAMDTWKVTPHVTVTYGLRATHNTSPISQDNQLSRINGDWQSVSHDPNTPLNQVIATGQSSFFNSTQSIVWQPRASVAWAVRPNTVVRVGAGYFSDIFPAFLIDQELRNFPSDNVVTSGATGTVPATYAIPGSGYNSTPGALNDGAAAAAFANQTLLSGFSSGVPSCTATNAPANCLPVLSGYFTVPKGLLKYPFFLESNASVQHQFGANWSVQASYVWTHAEHGFYTYAANGFQSVCQGCFAPFPYGAPLDSRFSSVTQATDGSNSNYNGLQLTATKRMSHGLMYNINYTWSHCIDQISNGGIFGFNGGATEILSPIPGELYRDNGNCDYDVRHALNASYVWQLPIGRGQALAGNAGKFLNGVIGGWQLSGDVIVHTGFPESALSPGYFANGNGVFNAGTPFSGLDTTADPVPGVSLYSKNTSLPSTQPGQIQWFNPAAFTATVDPTTGACTAGELNGTGDNPATCQFGSGGRNTLFGPGFANTDMFLGKTFSLTERLKLKIELQAYNLFNHPNFREPGSTFGVPSNASSLTSVGAVGVGSEASGPTSLLGAGLGGDSGVRMVAFRGMITF